MEVDFLGVFKNFMKSNEKWNNIVETKLKGKLRNNVESETETKLNLKHDFKVKLKKIWNKNRNWTQNLNRFPPPTFSHQKNGKLQ